MNTSTANTNHISSIDNDDNDNNNNNNDNNDNNNNNNDNNNDNNDNNDNNHNNNDKNNDNQNDNKNNRKYYAGKTRSIDDNTDWMAKFTMIESDDDAETKPNNGTMSLASCVRRCEISCNNNSTAFLDTEAELLKPIPPLTVHDNEHKKTSQFGGRKSIHDITEQHHREVLFHQNRLPPHDDEQKDLRTFHCESCIDINLYNTNSSCPVFDIEVASNYHYWDRNPERLIECHTIESIPFAAGDILHQTDFPNLLEPSSPSLLKTQSKVPIKIEPSSTSVSSSTISHYVSTNSRQTLSWNDLQISFRSIEPRDRMQIQKLHEEWFPVSYHDEFYDDLVYNRFYNTNEPLYTVIAVVTFPNEWNRESTTIELPSEKIGSTCLNTRKYPFQQYQCEKIKSYQQHSSQEMIDSNTSAMDRISFSSSSYPGLGRNSNLANRNGAISNKKAITTENNLDVQHKHDHKNTSSWNNDSSDVDLIVGCVVGSFVCLNQVSNQLKETLIYDPILHSQLFYIMTLGTCTNFRKSGLGTKLIEKCVHHAARNKRCGVVYLHVIVSNNAAIRLYEKLGFDRVEEIENYYTIDDVQHNCYLYAKYVNGNLGHRADAAAVVKEFIYKLWKNSFQKFIPLVCFFIWNSIRNIPSVPISTTLHEFRSRRRNQHCSSSTALINETTPPQMDDFHLPPSCFE